MRSPIHIYNILWGGYTYKVTYYSQLVFTSQILNGVFGKHSLKKCFVTHLLEWESPQGFLKTQNKRHLVKALIQYFVSLK